VPVAGRGAGDRAVPGLRVTLRAVLLDDLGVLSGTSEPLADVVPLLRAAGLRTAVLSNADGPARLGLVGLTDLVLLSGTTGLRKPSPAAFASAAARLGVRPQECVLVDDVAANVRGAVEAGMVGVLHRSRAGTLAELDAILDTDLWRSASDLLP
jgi:FMN phosphatase YigB (HAD superfamily)